VGLIRFPQERCSEAQLHTEPCLILILPVIRIEREVPPLIGRRAGRRVERAFDQLRADIERYRPRNR